MLNPFRVNFSALKVFRLESGLPYLLVVQPPCWSHDFVDKRFELALGQGAHFGCLDFAVTENHQGWYASDAVLPWSHVIAVYVQLGYFQFVAVLLSDFLYDRADHFAGPAPFRPVVHQDGAVCIEHFLVKTAVGNVRNFVTHIHSPDFYRIVTGTKVTARLRWSNSGSETGNGKPGAVMPEAGTVISRNCKTISRHQLQISSPFASFF